jgi:hypothetical protein
MALQRSPANDLSDGEHTAPPKGRGVRSWLRSVVGPSNGRDRDEAEDWPHGGSDGSSVGGSYDGSRGGSDGASAGAPYVEPNGVPHGAPDGASYGRPLHRIDNSIIVVGIDGSLVPSARDYALALIMHLQGHAVLREHWISSKALELEFYPEFLDASGWPPLPWLAISKVLKSHQEANETAHPVQGRQAGAPLHRAIQNSEADE